MVQNEEMTSIIWDTNYDFRQLQNTYDNDEINGRNIANEFDAKIHESENSPYNSYLRCINLHSMVGNDEGTQQQKEIVEVFLKICGFMER